MSSAAAPSWTTARIVGASIAPLLLIFAVLLLPAGRFDWPRGWLYVALVCTTVLASFIYLNRANPGLIESRSRIGPGTKRWDLVWGGVFGPLFLSIYIVAGLDAVRFGWTSMTVAWWPVGLLVFGLGNWLFTWAMGVNPFFEKTVRIQSERGHRVIDTGPYRFVRHPGYVGFSGWSLSAPLLLGSWWAFAPAILTLAAIVIRTALEDRTLHEELPGYADYAERTRYRLLPGVW